MMSLRPEDGFSLLEILIASAILVFALMGMNLVFAIGFGQLAEGEALTRGYASTQSLLDMKRSQPYVALLADDLDGDGVAETVLRDDGLAPDSVAGDGIYTALRVRDEITRLWTVEPDRPIAGMSRVVVATRWRDADGVDREFASVILRHDPAFPR